MYAIISPARTASSATTPTRLTTSLAVVFAGCTGLLWLASTVEDAEGAEGGGSDWPLILIFGVCTLLMIATSVFVWVRRGRPLTG